MTALVPCLRAHRPHRLARLRFVDVGRGRSCFDEARERREVELAAERAYLPAFELVLEAFESTRGAFRCALAITGSLVARLERWAPDACAALARLARTGAVEFVCGTGWNAAAIDGDELRDQLKAQRELLRRIGGVEPRTLRDATLAGGAALAREADALGFECLLAEDGRGGDGRSPRRVHRAAEHPRLAVLLRDRALSDALGTGALDARGLAERLAAEGGDGVACVELALEGARRSFGGEPDPSVVHRFLRELPRAGRALRLETPSEAARGRAPAPPLELPEPALASELAREAHRRLVALLPLVRAASVREPAFLRDWRRLSDAEHLLAMTDPVPDDCGAAPPLDRAAPCPPDSFITFMHALDDLQARAERSPRERAVRATARRKTSTSKKKRSAR